MAEVDILGMKKTSYHFLRVGLAITFLWVGILILKSPEAWGSLLQPWAAALLPLPLKEAMIGTAFLDIAVGVAMLVDFKIWIWALIGAAHIGVVLTTTGINDITIRDIGLLVAVLALMIESFPASISEKLFSWEKRNNNKPQDH
jgi:hypothetical protein